jgi:hypothetical protein
MSVAECSQPWGPETSTSLRAASAGVRRSCASRPGHVAVRERGDRRDLAPTVDSQQAVATRVGQHLAGARRDQPVRVGVGTVGVRVDRFLEVADVGDVLPGVLHELGPDQPRHVRQCRHLIPERRIGAQPEGHEPNQPGEGDVHRSDGRRSLRRARRSVGRERRQAGEHPGLLATVQVDARDGAREAEARRALRAQEARTIAAAPGLGYVESTVGAEGEPARIVETGGHGLDGRLGAGWRRHGHAGEEGRGCHQQPERSSSGHETPPVLALRSCQCRRTPPVVGFRYGELNGPYASIEADPWQCRTGEGGGAGSRSPR